MRLWIGLCGVLAVSVVLHLGLFLSRMWLVPADYVEFVPAADWTHGHPVNLEPARQIVIEENLRPARVPSAIQLADGEREVRHVEPKIEAKPVAPPATLAPVDPKAAPVRDAVREIVENELADASAEEREIWYEQFRGLPAEVIRDMLRVRKEFGSLSPRPQSPPREPSHPVTATSIPATRLPAASPGSIRWSDVCPDLQTLQKAGQIHWENLVHAETPGFLARTVELKSATEPTTGTCLTLAQHRLKLSVTVSTQPGNPLETGNPHDLRLLGNFWLRVRQGEQIGYTRFGRLERFADGRVGIQSGSSRWMLEPEIKIPEEVTTWTILPDGVLTWGRETTPLPRLPIVQVTAEKEFTPLDAVVMGEASEVDARIVQIQDTPRLVIGQLTGSNSHAENELLALKRLQEHRQQLELALELLLGRNPGGSH